MLKFFWVNVQPTSLLQEKIIWYFGPLHSQNTHNLNITEVRETLFLLLSTDTDMLLDLSLK
jgi:hypothetical protein